jgi:tetratricopeptide (TPR) repeat protein
VVVAGIVALLQVQSRALGQAHYAQARQAATTGDTLRALDELTEALLHDRAFADAYRLRGTLRLRYRGDWAGAYPDFRAALAHAETDDDSLRRELARVCLKLNKNSEALAHLREAIRLNARSGWAFLLRGVAQAQLGDTTAACRDWAHARRLDEYRGVEFEERYCP